MKSYKIILPALLLALMQMAYGQEQTKNDSNRMNEVNLSMCRKLPMQADGIIRLSKIEVFPEYLDAYKEFATEVGEVSLRTEPGVLTMYAVAEKENPCRITILETYASQAAYQAHIASPHFQKYKQGTLHMVKSLMLSDQTALNPDSEITNCIKSR
ncbi:MAG: antibiotic biosynthesis monooxygenase [Bacteroides sp.]|nr:antibiotic biosynthesis monooxygenase [Bacteroides sp.]